MKVQSYNAAEVINILSLPGFSFGFKNFYIYTEKYIVGDVQ